MPDFILYKRDGSITNTVKFEQAFNELNDGKYLVKIDSVKKRTLPQNAYYHAVVVPMVKDGLRDAGYSEVRTNEDAHEVLKQLFLKRTMVSEKNGDAITITGSTATLRTVEFNYFLEEVWQWAAEYLGISIPAPNEQLVMFASHDSETGATIVENENVF